MSYSLFKIFQINFIYLRLYLDERVAVEMSIFKKKRGWEWSYLD